MTDQLNTNMLAILRQHGAIVRDAKQVLRAPRLVFEPPFDLVTYGLAPA